MASPLQQAAASSSSVPAPPPRPMPAAWRGPSAQVGSDMERGHGMSPGNYDVTLHSVSLMCLPCVLMGARNMLSCGRVRHATHEGHCLYGDACTSAEASSLPTPLKPLLRTKPRVPDSCARSPRLPATRQNATLGMQYRGGRLPPTSIWTAKRRRSLPTGRKER